MADYTQDTNCQVAYLYSEGSGTTVADATSNGRNGTFNSSGHPAWDASVPNFGILGSAIGSVNYSSSGSSEIISDGTSDNILPYNGAWTGVSWIYPTVDSGASGDPRIFVRGSVAVSISTTATFYIQIDGSTAFIKTAAINSLTLNAWNHVAATWDGNLDATLHGHLYVNGAEVGSYATEQNGNTLTSNSGATFYPGNRSDGARSLTGKQTEVAIFNRELSSTEILDIYNYGLKPTTTFRKSAAMMQVF